MSSSKKRAAAYISKTSTRDYVKHISIVVSCRQGCRVRPVPSKVNIAGVVIICVSTFREPDPPCPPLFNVDVSAGGALTWEAEKNISTSTLKTGGQGDCILCELIWGRPHRRFISLQLYLPSTD